MSIAEPPIKIKLPREEVPADKVLCEYCSAKCCKYFALPMDTPDTRKEFDFVRWFLLHGQASCFVEDGTWYLLVHTQCKHLRDDNLCGIYHTRPQICREYTTAECEYEDDWVYDQYFETAEQVDEYAEAILPRKKGESIRSPKPALLPLL